MPQALRKEAEVGRREAVKGGPGLECQRVGPRGLITELDYPPEPEMDAPTTPPTGAPRALHPCFLVSSVLQFMEVEVRHVRPF